MTSQLKTNHMKKNHILQKRRKYNSGRKCNWQIKEQWKVFGLPSCYLSLSFSFFIFFSLFFTFLADLAVIFTSRQNCRWEWHENMAAAAWAPVRAPPAGSGQQQVGAGRQQDFFGLEASHTEKHRQETKDKAIWPRFQQFLSAVGDLLLFFGFVCCCGLNGSAAWLRPLRQEVTQIWILQLFIPYVRLIDIY